MKKLIGFLFPVPYPQAAVFHIFLGGVIGCLGAQAFGGSGSGGTGWGCLAGLIIGFILWLLLKPGKSLNDKASMLLVLVLAGLSMSCQRTPQPTQGLTATEAELFPSPRLVTDSAGWTRPVLVTAR